MTDWYALKGKQRLDALFDSFYPNMGQAPQEGERHDEFGRPIRWVARHVHPNRHARRAVMTQGGRALRRHVRAQIRTLHEMRIRSGSAAWRSETLG